MLKSLRPFAFAVAALVAIPLSSAVAQGEFVKGTKHINLGIMTGGNGGGTGFGGGVEVSVLQIAPNVHLGIGATAGYISDSNFGVDVSVIPVFASGNVHFSLPNVPQLDLFGGVAVGVTRSSVDIGVNVPGVDGSASSTDTAVGILLGGRYMFSNKFGAFGQLGLTDELPELFLGVTIGF